MVRTVLIHNSKALDTSLLWATFSDIDDPGIEIPILAGNTVINRVGDNMRNASPIHSCCREGPANHLRFRKDVPKTKFNPYLAIRQQFHFAIHERLRVYDAPIRESRPYIQRFWILQKGTRINRQK